MYKDGKKMVFAAIATLSFFVAGGISTIEVHADTVSESTSAATASSASDTKNPASSTATTTASATSNSAAKSDTAGATSSSAAKSDTASATSSSATAQSSAAGESVSSAKNTKVQQITFSELLTQARVATRADDTAMSHVTKENFLDYFTLNGSATYDAATGIVTITPDEKDQVGNFSLSSKIDMGTSFHLKGQVNLGDRTRTTNPSGADGVSFAFHNGNITDVGNAGGNLGLGGLQDALGFKLDTWHNGYRQPQSNVGADVDGAQVSPNNSDAFGWDADPTTSTGAFGAFVNTTKKMSPQLLENLLSVGGHPSNQIRCKK